MHDSNMVVKEGPQVLDMPALHWKEVILVLEIVVGYGERSKLQNDPAMLILDVNG